MRILASVSTLGELCDTDQKLSVFRFKVIGEELAMPPDAPCVSLEINLARPLTDNLLLVKGQSVEPTFGTV